MLLQVIVILSILYSVCMALMMCAMHLSFTPKQDRRKEESFDIPEVSRITVFKAVSTALKTDREYQKKINRLRKRGYSWL